MCLVWIGSNYATLSVTADPGLPAMQDRLNGLPEEQRQEALQNLETWPRARLDDPAPGERVLDGGLRRAGDACRRALDFPRRRLPAADADPQGVRRGHRRHRESREHAADAVRPEAVHPPGTGGIRRGGGGQNLLRQAAYRHQPVRPVAGVRHRHRTVR